MRFQSSMTHLFTSVLIVIGAFFFMGNKNAVLAAPAACTALASGFTVDKTGWPATPTTGGSYAPATLIIRLGTGYSDGTYKVMCSHDTTITSSGGDNDEIFVTSVNKTLTATFPTNKCFSFNGDSPGLFGGGDLDMYVKLEQVDTSKNPPSTIGTPCTAMTYTLKGYSSIACGAANFTIATNDGLNGCFAPSDQITWSISNLKTSDGAAISGSFPFHITGTNVNTTVNLVNGAATGTGSVTGVSPSKITAVLEAASGSYQNCSRDITTIKLACTPDDRSSNPIPVNPDTYTSPDFALCAQAGSAKEREACEICFCKTAGCTTDASATQNLDDKKIWTAFGCVDTSQNGIVTSIIRIGMGLAGGFVLLSILYGSFLLTTSSGDPKRVQEGQEMISSAVIGLLFVIFSVIILRFIGVSVLQLPGFGT